MSSSAHHKKKETVTSGPFFVPLLTPGYAPNNRIVVTLKNPTHKKLSVFVSLGICKECPPAGWQPPQSPAPTPVPGPPPPNQCIDTIKTLEKEISLGFHHVDPMSCLRIEKTFDYYYLGNTVLRVEAKGDFNVDHECNTLLGGLLEISSVVGFINLPMANTITLPDYVTANLQQSAGLYYNINGLDVADPSTFIAFGDYVVVKKHANSDSSSSSSSSSDH
ncbi:hypothetical protein SAMN04488542_108116 [Fontibacillus panacisegetis]|uniref:Uncharacterized protein n=1 Tax=Fontibacillus panacisegetis TaxID=670482 RepID=A0A1G7JUV6_9BACL|nr:hypothetical protein [Fontibacillus panacisegetis]SDF28750.1 hypothetical protein SAMN04488542_108116 [Fontibacillus panacisegetis]